MLIGLGVFNLCTYTNAHLQFTHGSQVRPGGGASICNGNRSTKSTSNEIRKCEETFIALLWLLLIFFCPHLNMTAPAAIFQQTLMNYLSLTWKWKIRLYSFVITNFDLYVAVVVVNTIFHQGFNQMVWLAGCWVGRLDIFRKFHLKLVFREKEFPSKHELEIRWTRMI